MDYKYIEQLVERYWAGETTVEEERILRDFFSQPEIPEHLREEAVLFRSFAADQDVKLDEAFDQRVLARVEKEESQVVVPLRPVGFVARVRPLFRAAAAVAIVFLVSYSVVRSVEEKTPADNFAQMNDTTIVTNLETVQPVQVGVKTATVDSFVVDRK